MQDFFNSIDNLKQDRDTNTKQWISSVECRVIQPLDRAADNLIRNTSIKVGIKTAISPRGIVDSLIVLTHSWLLIRNLCRIYNLRPKPLETCIILGSQDSMH